MPILLWFGLLLGGYHQALKAEPAVVEIVRFSNQQPLDPIANQPTRHGEPRLRLTLRVEPPQPLAGIDFEASQVVSLTNDHSRHLRWESGQPLDVHSLGPMDGRLGVHGFDDASFVPSQTGEDFLVGVNIAPIRFSGASTLTIVGQLAGILPEPHYTELGQTTVAIKPGHGFSIGGFQFHMESVSSLIFDEQPYTSIRLRTLFQVTRVEVGTDSTDEPAIISKVEPYSHGFVVTVPRDIVNSHRALLIGGRKPYHKLMTFRKVVPLPGRLATPLTH